MGILGSWHPGVMDPGILGSWDLGQEAKEKEKEGRRRKKKEKGRRRRKEKKKKKKKKKKPLTSIYTNSRSTAFAAPYSIISNT